MNPEFQFQAVLPFSECMLPLVVNFPMYVYCHRLTHFHAIILISFRFNHVGACHARLTNVHG